MELSQNQKLDIILKFYRDKEFDANFDKQNHKWVETRKKACGENMAEFYFLIKKIMDDGYVDRLNSIDFISIKGQSFIGYEKTELENKRKEKREEDRLELELITKRREVKFFYPILICGFLTGLTALLSQLNIISLPEVDLWNKKDSVLVSNGTKRVDSIETSTISISTKK